MKLDQAQVEHVAMLARLALSSQEQELFSTQLSAILEYMEKLDKLDTKKVEPLFHPLSIANVLRSDEHTPSLARQAALGNAPESSHSSFKVPKVIE